MKKKMRYLLFLLLLVPYIHFASNRDSNSDSSINDRYHNSIIRLVSSAVKFDSIVSITNSKKDVLDSYNELRMSFRNSEIFIDRIDPEFIKRNINGAPLPWIDEKSTRIDVMHPEGLQVIDELLSEKDYNQSELKELSKKLVSKLNLLAKYQTNITISKRIVFESLRLSIIKIFTLQISGFDTPGSLSGVVESKWTLQESKEIFEELVNKPTTLSDRIINLYNLSITYIDSSNNFDSFDRLKFYKNYLSKLSKQLLDYQLECGVETVDDISSLPTSTNYSVTDIFSNNFLNKYFFANIYNSKNENQRIELGKKLFFDPILSNNNNKTCASCHIPSKLFTDGTKFPKSDSKDDPITRNTPTLINAILAKDYFYDLRSGDLSSQIENVFTNHKEFNSSLEQILSKINDNPEYISLFDSAFENFNPKQELSLYFITNAISYYLSSLVDFESDFDKFIRNEPNAYLSETAKKGFNLFMGKAQCGICHFPPTFSGLLPPFYVDTESEVIGVPSDTTNSSLDSDIGVFVSGRLKHKALKNKNAFKTLSVRNLVQTAPYFHNGVYDNLEDVLNFYNEGGGNGFGFRIDNQTLSSDKLNLNKEEMDSIIEFLKSLSNINYSYEKADY